MIRILLLLASLLTSATLLAESARPVRLVASGFNGTNFSLAIGETLTFRSVLFSPQDRYPSIRVTYPELITSLPLQQGDMVSGPAVVNVQGYSSGQVVAVECIWTYNSTTPPLRFPKQIRVERSSDMSLWEPIAVIREEEEKEGFWRLTWE